MCFRVYLEVDEHKYFSHLDFMEGRFFMIRNNNTLIKPFVKWVGGKRQLLDDIYKYMPDVYSTYYEPFLGGGALFLNEQPKKAIVNDENIELINAYKVIQSDVEGLIEELKVHKKKDNEDYFYDVRGWDRNPEYENYSDAKRAARLIYLNKTCFNGLYRVNSSGYFNTPYGRYKDPNIVNEYGLRALNTYFNSADIRFITGDFEDAVKYIRSGAFVYFDPPYAPISSTSNYTGYTISGFDKEDQVRLRNLCDKLHSRGVNFLLSNSNVPFISNLYENPEYKIEIVGAKRSINSNGKKRGEVEEVLIRNYNI